MQKWLGFFYFDIHFLFAFFVFFSSEICLKLVDPMLGRIRYFNGGVTLDNLDFIVMFQL